MGISFSGTHKDRAIWFTGSHAGPFESHWELMTPLNIMIMLPLTHNSSNNVHLQYPVTSTQLLVRILNILRDSWAVCQAPAGDSTER